MNIKEEQTELLEIIGTLSLSEETDKKYEELSKKIDSILKKSSIKKKMKKTK